MEILGYTLKIKRVAPPGGGDDLHMKRVAYLLAKGCKFQSLVSLRMFWGKHHYDM